MIKMSLVENHNYHSGLGEIGTKVTSVTMASNLDKKTLLEVGVDHVISPFRFAVTAKLSGNSNSKCTFVLSNVECIEPFEDYDGDNHYSFIVKEFVRELLSKGRRVSCQVEKFADLAKAFGTLIIHPDDRSQDDINLNLELLRNGYAKLRDFPTQPYRKASSEEKRLYKIYMSIQEEAQAKKLNFWGLTADQVRAMRKKARILEGDMKDFFEKYQGKNLKAYVDKIYNLTVYQLVIYAPTTPDSFLLPHYRMRVELSGITTFPPVGKENQESDKLYNNAISFLVDTVLLKTTTFCPNTIRKVGPATTICGYIKYPNTANSLSYILLANGYVMPYPATAEIDEDIKNFYVKICDHAINNKIGYWGEVHEKASSFDGMGPSDSPIKARVLQAINGSTILVKDKDKNVERKIHLTGIRIPSSPANNNADGDECLKLYDVGMKARNELAKLVGSDVDITIDYQYVDPNTKTVLYFATVSSNNCNNAALNLLSKGLADVNYSKNHLMNIPPSKLFAYERVYRMAASKDPGGHSKSQATLDTVMDYSNSNRSPDQIARLFDPAKAYSGVIQSIFSPTKYKVYFQKMKCIVVLSLANVYFPSSRVARSPKSQNAAKAVRDEVMNYVRDNFLQRSVLVTNISLLEEAKGSTFKMITAEFYLSTKNNSPGEDLAQILLSHGYVMSAHSRTTMSQKLTAAHAKAMELAKRNKTGLWALLSKQNAEKDGAEDSEARGNARTKAADIKSAFLTYVSHDDLAPYFQIFSSAEEREALDKKLAKLNSDNFTREKLDLDSKSCDGVVCCAKYSADNCYYRVKILGESSDEPGAFNVFFIDYGNSETVPSSSITQLPEDLSPENLPPLAVKYHLAYIDDTAPFDQYIVGFVSTLTSMSQDSQIKCRTVQNNEMKREEIILFDSDISTINEKLVLEGYAPIQSWCMMKSTREALLPHTAFDPGSSTPGSSAKILDMSPYEFIHRLKSAQEIAKSERRNMWISGDFIDYEPPANPPPQRRRRDKASQAGQ